MRKKFTPTFLLILTCIIFLGIAIFLMFRSNFFTVKKVDINLDQVPCVDDLTLKNSLDSLGKNLFFMDTEKIASEIKLKYICIKEVKIARLFPDRVNLIVSGRQAVAKLIKLSSREATGSGLLENIATPSSQVSTEGYLIDSSGTIFLKILEQINIPNIFIKDIDIFLGEKLDNSYANSLKILQRVKIFNLQFKDSQILNNFLVIFPQNSSPRIIFKLDSQIEAQLASLQLILEKAKIDDRILEFIDLRFDKPIVRFAPKK